MRGLNAVVAAPGDAWAGPVTRAERMVALALLALPLLAGLLPALPLPAHYHAFADQRALWCLPHAMDVLSNLAYAGMTACGAWLLHRHGAGTAGAPRGLLRLLCAGLLAIAVCSAFHHLAPGDTRLVLDRLGMTPAFAAVLGLVVDARVSRRAGLVVAAATATMAVITAVVAGAWGNMAPCSRCCCWPPARRGLVRCIFRCLRSLRCTGWPRRWSCWTRRCWRGARAGYPATASSTWCRRWRWRP